MATINAANLVAFCNGEIRPTADLLVQLYWTCKRITSDWSSQSLSASFAGGVADVIVDGAPADGRNALTSADVQNVMARVASFVNFMERNTLDTSGTSNNAVLNTVIPVAVNRAPRF